MPNYIADNGLQLVVMLKPISLLLHSFLLLVLIGTFSSMVYFIRNDPGVSAAPAALPLTPALTPTSASIPAPSASPLPPLSPSPFPLSSSPFIPDPAWSLIRPGLERRVIEVYNAQNQSVESVYIWRLDQTLFRLDIAYDNTPKSLDTWQRETSALMVVNGGYYSIRNENYYYPDGLTIVDGQASGRSFNRGGMLAIDGQRAEIRWLAEEPYNAGEPLQAALQSFPILVEPGGGLGYGSENESYARARRTVIAQDRQGRILFMVAPKGYFTLHELSLYLTGSDLDLDIAVNLDGGGSTGILVAEPYELIAPTRPIPFVILVHAR